MSMVSEGIPHNRRLLFESKLTLCSSLSFLTCTIGPVSRLCITSSCSLSVDFLHGLFFSVPPAVSQCHHDVTTFIPFLIGPFQADDVRALLTAAMPPSALPACCKPQVISVPASVGTVPTTTLPSGAPGCPMMPSTSGLDAQCSSFPELPCLLGPSGAERPAEAERKEEGESLCGSQ